MSGSAKNIVHESETQRQHIRLQLPVEIGIGDARYTAEDWSYSGVAIALPKDEMDDHTLVKQKSSIRATLYFNFPEFDMSIPVDVEVRNVDKEKGRIGCSFTNLNDRQVSLLQYIVSAFVSGQIVTAGDFIDVVSRNNQTTARKLPSAADEMSASQMMARKFSKFMRAGGIVAVSVALIGYVLLGLYERAYVVKASSASVATETIVVEAPKSGKIYYQPLKPGTEVAKGEPLLMVETDNGNLASVDSPCDCIIRERLEDNHARTATGKPVLKLLSSEAAPYVAAYVPFEDATKLSRGRTVALSFRGYDRYLNGTIKSIDAGDGQATTLLVIEPSEALPKELIGEPVDVKIDLLSSN